MRGRATPATIAIIVVNLLFFAAEIALGGTQDPNVIARLGGIIHGTLPRLELWRLLTAMFLHIGPLHIAVNLWALYQLGGLFEMMFGTKRFLLTYFASGIIASVASAIRIEPQAVSAGASGAIFGILGALIFAVRRSPVFRHQAWTRGLMQQLIGWAVINILIGLRFPAIDNAAHMGGFVAGLILGFIPHNVPPPPPGEMTWDAEARAIEERKNEP